MWSRWHQWKKETLVNVVTNFEFFTVRYFFEKRLMTAVCEFLSLPGASCCFCCNENVRWFDVLCRMHRDFRAAKSTDAGHDFYQSEASGVMNPLSHYSDHCFRCQKACFAALRILRDCKNMLCEICDRPFSLKKMVAVQLVSRLAIHI